MALRIFAVSRPSIDFAATSSMVRISPAVRTLPSVLGAAFAWAAGLSCRSLMETRDPLTTKSLCLFGDSKMRSSGFIVIYLCYHPSFFPHPRPLPEGEGETFFSRVGESKFPRQLAGEG